MRRDLFLVHFERHRCKKIERIKLYYHSSPFPKNDPRLGPRFIIVYAETRTFSPPRSSQTQNCVLYTAVADKESSRTVLARLSVLARRAVYDGPQRTKMMARPWHRPKRQPGVYYAPSQSQSQSHPDLFVLAPVLILAMPFPSVFHCPTDNMYISGNPIYFMYPNKSGFYQLSRLPRHPHGRHRINPRFSYRLCQTVLSALVSMEDPSQLLALKSEVEGMLQLLNKVCPFSSSLPPSLPSQCLSPRSSIVPLTCTYQATQFILCIQINRIFTDFREHTMSRPSVFLAPPTIGMQ